MLELVAVFIAKAVSVSEVVAVEAMVEVVAAAEEETAAGKEEAAHLFFATCVRRRPTEADRERLELRGENEQKEGKA